jgi:hypothetical protein
MSKREEEFDVNNAHAPKTRLVLIFNGKYTAVPSPMLPP